jgi:hypothetical protein
LFKPCGRGTQSGKGIQFAFAAELKRFKCRAATFGAYLARRKKFGAAFQTHVTDKLITLRAQTPVGSEIFSH